MPEKMRLRAGHTDVKVYPYKPELEAEFLQFCKDVVHPWLLGVGATQADFWTFKQAGVSMLVIALNNDSEWDGIPGIQRFLLDPGYPNIQSRPELKLG